ncbi:hypothetical protein [Methanocella sp. MCL-LM]
MDSRCLVISRKYIRLATVIPGVVKLWSQNIFKAHMALIALNKKDPEGA